MVLSQHSWGPGWSKSRAVCHSRQGCPSAGSCAAKRSLVPAWGWDVVTWNRVRGLISEPGRELQFVPGQGRAWREAK